MKQVTVESLGSVWLIDETRECYLRMPKAEMKRLPGNWAEPEPGDALYDLEWHPMERWWISEVPVPVMTATGVAEHAEHDCPLLVIVQPDGYKVLAPRAEVRGG
jgi:hypothetical protein